MNEPTPVDGSPRDASDEPNDVQPQTSEPRILVGIITWDGQKYCRKKFFHWLTKLTYEHFDILVVTNSGGDDKKDIERAAQPLIESGKTVSVFVNDEEVEHKYDYLVSNRNIAREEFLKGPWSHLLFFDSDIIMPINIIEVMLKHDKQLMTGVYLSTFESGSGKPVIRPVVYGFDRPGFARQLTIHEVVPPRLIRVAAAGLGCCMIRKDVLEKVEFKRNVDSQSTEDSIFFLECRRDHEIFLWCDTRIKCLHLKFPVNDKRNALLDWRNYKLEFKKK